MNTRPDKVTATPTERFLGLGEPRLRSRFWVAAPVVVTASAAGLILRQVLSEGWDERLFPQMGMLFVGLWLLSDVGGAFLFVRRGTTWGRALRVFGYVVFFPLAIAFYLIGSWLTLPWLFVT